MSPHLASKRIVAADAPSFAEVIEHEAGVYVVVGHTRVGAMRLLERTIGTGHADTILLRSNGSVWRESDGRWLGGAISAHTARTGGLAGVHASLVVVALEDESLLDDPIIAEAVSNALTGPGRWFIAEEAA